MDSIVKSRLYGILSTSLLIVIFKKHVIAFEAHENLEMVFVTIMYLKSFNSTEN